MSVATLALFVLTFLFLAQKQTAEKDLATLKESTKEIVTESERNADNLRNLIRDAKPKSLAAYMVEQAGTLGEKTVGSGKETPKSLSDLIAKKQEGSNAANLAALIDDLNGKITQLDKQAKDADAARQVALTNYQNEVALTKRQKDDYDAAMAAVTGDINKYKDAADQLRQQVNELSSNLAAQIAKIKAQAEDENRRTQQPPVEGRRRPVQGI